jgi:hypothetical protein
MKIKVTGAAGPVNNNDTIGLFHLGQNPDERTQVRIQPSGKEPRQSPVEPKSGSILTVKGSRVLKEYGSVIMYPEIGQVPFQGQPGTVA